MTATVTTAASTRPETSDEERPVADIATVADYGTAMAALEHLSSSLDSMKFEPDKQLSEERRRIKKKVDARRVRRGNLWDKVNADDVDVEERFAELGGIQSTVAEVSEPVTHYTTIGLDPVDPTLMRVTSKEVTYENREAFRVLEDPRLRLAYDLSVSLLGEPEKQYSAAVSSFNAASCRVEAVQTRLAAEQAALDEQARLDAEQARLDAEQARLEAELLAESASIHTEIVDMFGAPAKKRYQRARNIAAIAATAAVAVAHFANGNILDPAARMALGDTETLQSAQFETELEFLVLGAGVWGLACLVAVLSAAVLSGKRTWQRIAYGPSFTEVLHLAQVENPADLSLESVHAAKHAIALINSWPAPFGAWLMRTMKAASWFMLAAATVISGPGQAVLIIAGLFLLGWSMHAKRRGQRTADNLPSNPTWLMAIVTVFLGLMAVGYVSDNHTELRAAAVSIDWVSNRLGEVPSEDGEAGPLTQNSLRRSNAETAAEALDLDVVFPTDTLRIADITGSCGNTTQALLEVRGDFGLVQTTKAASGTLYVQPYVGTNGWESWEPATPSSFDRLTGC